MAKSQSVEPLQLTTNPRIDIPFLFDSYRSLTRDLGAMDGLAAAQTLASKRFVDDAIRSDNPQEYALSLARHYRVPTRYVDYERLPSHLYQLLIVGTYQQAEAFLIEFYSEQSRLGRRWRSRLNGESRLGYTLDCIEGGLSENKLRIHLDRFLIYEYYRLVRNAFVHSSIDKKRLADRFAEVSEFRDLVKEKFGLEAPNAFEEITFDDHMLFTRVVKYIATDICRLAPPTTSNELIRVLLDLPPRHFTKLLGLKTDQERFYKGLLRVFKETYNFDISKHKPTAEEVRTWCNTIPSRRERKKCNLGLVSVYARSVFNANIDG